MATRVAGREPVDAAFCRALSCSLLTGFEGRLADILRLTQRREWLHKQLHKVCRVVLCICVSKVLWLAVHCSSSLQISHLCQ